MLAMESKILIRMNVHVMANKWIFVFLVLLFSHLAAGFDTTLSPPPLGKLIDVGGYRVHLYCMGAGSPTVIVVGGAFSFDWGLIQPAVAKFTQTCTYDSSGTAWSDPYQKQKNLTPNCDERVAEIHRLLQRADIPGPYVLAGFSIGGLIGRLYAEHHPEDVAGMVIVDHAFTDTGSDAPPALPVSSKLPSSKTSGEWAMADSPPVLISSAPITLGLEDDQNFRRLSQRDQDLHTWAMSNHPLRPTTQMAEECSAAVESATQNQPLPFGGRPLIIIRTNNDLPGYGKLQAKLVRLSRNSKSVIAEKSSHMVIIDEPELVISSIREVVQAARNGTKLK